ncbi:unnamed protein product, partial [Clonostachys rosea]
MVLELDHLNQTAAWVQRKGRTEAAPERASFEYSQGLIEDHAHKYGSNTLPNMERPPDDDSDFWRSGAEPGTDLNCGRENKRKCDLCTYMITQQNLDNWAAFPRKFGKACAFSNRLSSLPLFLSAPRKHRPQKIDAPFEGQNNLEAALNLAALDKTLEAVTDDSDENMTMSDK